MGLPLRNNMRKWMVVVFAVVVVLFTIELNVSLPTAVTIIFSPQSQMLINRPSDEGAHRQQQSGASGSCLRTTPSPPPPQNTTTMAASPCSPPPRAASSSLAVEE